MNTPRNQYKPVMREKVYPSDNKKLAEAIEQRMGKTEEELSNKQIDLQKDLAESYKQLLTRKERGENVDAELLQLRIHLNAPSSGPDRYEQLRKDAIKEQEKQKKIAQAIEERYSDRYQTEEEAAAEEAEFQAKLERIRNA